MRMSFFVFWIAGAAWLSPARTAAGEADKPNVVILFCDDLGYGDLGCFGHPTIATPHLDRMAAEGQRWTNFYVAASVCTPSRAGLMTGRYPIRSGMCSDTNRVLFPDSAGGLPASELTIAEVMKGAGYATAAVGKWHLGHRPPYLPTEHGFDTYFGIPYSNDMDKVKGSKDHFSLAEEEDFAAYHVPLLRDKEEVERPADQRTITRRYAEEAVKFIRENRERPFFVYLAHSLPHIPLFRDEAFKGKSRAGIYGDVIEEIDWTVGQITGVLNELELAKKTLVVFTSDNGPWLVFKTHGGTSGLLRGGKGMTWEGGMRVPTVFWWPGTVRPGVVMEAGSTLDLLPTAAALAGFPLPEDLVLDGGDLSPVLKSGKGSPRDSMIFYRGEKVYAARLGKYKAHFITQGAYTAEDRQAVVHARPLLFDLEVDPGENFDIGGENPDIISKIEELVEEHRESVVPVENQLNKRG